MSPLGEDVLHREPKVGQSLYEGGGELRPGLRVQWTWGSRSVSYVAGSQDVRFDLLDVAVVVGLDPPSNNGLVFDFFSDTALLSEATDEHDAATLSLAQTSQNLPSTSLGE
jgi:hypothetical protein